MVGYFFKLSLVHQWLCKCWLSVICQSSVGWTLLVAGCFQMIQSSSTIFFSPPLRSVLLVRWLETRERQPYTETPQRDLNLFIDVYMQYIMYVFLKNFRIWTRREHHKPQATPAGGVSATSNAREVMEVMHLFILRVNLLTCFSFLFSCPFLSALHEKKMEGICIFHVFFYLVFSKLCPPWVCLDFLLRFLISRFSNRALSLIIFLWT